MYFGTDTESVSKSGKWRITTTRRSGRGSGSGLSRRPSATLKMAGLGPVARARGRGATSMNPGSRPRVRIAYRRSFPTAIGALRKESVRPYGRGRERVSAGALGRSAPRDPHLLAFDQRVRRVVHHRLPLAQ